MHIVVIADGSTQKEVQDKGIVQGVNIQFVGSIEDVHRQADAYFFLLQESSLATNYDAIAALQAPVFVNAVITTLDNLPANCVRINGWPGFLLNPVLEICAREEQKAIVQQVLEPLGWKYQFVPDIPGLITPRTIAMIINEAYFALGDEVSSKDEIDTAMKLGTNYPHGPFEWSRKIGLRSIFDLLSHLAKNDARYTPAPTLTKEIEEQ